MKRALKTLFKKGQSNLTKIICLSLGLALGLLMLAEVIYERSADRFIPRLKDTYRVEENYKMKGQDWYNFPQTSGAHAPGIKSVCPEVEAATRFTQVTESTQFVTEDRKILDGTVFLCDSSFFDVFPRRILMGEDPRTGLNKTGQAYISDKLLEVVGPGIIGKTLTLKTNENFRLTVVGVFEALPENTHLSQKMDILLAMPTVTELFGGFDGSNNWFGNDRYRGYVRLRPGTDPSSLQARMDKLLQDHDPDGMLQKSGSSLRLTLRPVKEIFYISESNRVLNFVFLGFGIIMILVSLFNYILLVVSSMVNRAKSIATYRCYGAGSKDIYKMILGESFLHVCCISLPLAVLFIFSMQNFIQEQIGHSLHGLFTPSTLVICAVIVLLVTLLCGCLPGYLYTRIPVTYAYRRYTENKRWWKLGLLFFQFMLTSFFVSMLVVIGLQYNKLTHFETGFNYKDVLTVNLRGVSAQERELTLTELRNNPAVAGVTWGYQHLAEGSSGDNVFNPETHEEYCNIADLYSVGDDYFHTLEISVVEGREFTRGLVDSLNNEVMVSRSFFQKMKETAGWTGSSVGKSVWITAHEGKPYVIVGVFEDLQIGSLYTEDIDTRPQVMFYNSIKGWDISLMYIRLKQMSPENIRVVQQVLDRAITRNPKQAVSLNTTIGNNYQQVEHVRNSVIFVGICVLVIALIGLIAYLLDEINRRRSEIAVRRIVGASLADLQRVFQRDLLLIAIPSMLIGILLAWIVSNRLIQLFATQIKLTWNLFGGCLLAVLLVVMCFALALVYRKAQVNPTENLRNE